jgi:hypothetical protein
VKLTCKIGDGVSLAAPFGGRAMPKWRNWQTRMVQVHVPARVWGFESLLRHQQLLPPCNQLVTGRFSAEGRHFGGPSLISEKSTSASTDDLRNMIANGKGRMPKYAGKLSPEQIDALVQQIKLGNKK